MAAVLSYYGTGIGTGHLSCRYARDDMVVPGVRYGIYDDRGGPGMSTVTLVLTIYNSAFKGYDMGYASAVALLLFVLVLVFQYFQKRFLGERYE